jgi:RNase P/RNase MRP subunit POP5
MPSEQKPRLKPSKRPRYRYILFRIAGTAPDRNELIRTIQAASGAEIGAWLTRYEAGRGILRVLRGQEAKARRILQALPGGVQTVSTSGTIAALERGDRHGRRGQVRQD